MPATRSYKVRGIVLRKTKLGEKDLIVTMLLEDGSLARAVAKGARKPGGSLAARLDLFCAVDAMLAQGRNLDVVTEARLVGGTQGRTFGLEQSACAAAIAELLSVVAQEGLEHPRIYEMTSMAFDAIAASEPYVALSIMAADLLKTLASVGFRPSLDACVECGQPLGELEGTPRTVVSFEDGGVVCASCPRPIDAVLIESNVIAWARALLFARFEEVQSYEIDESTLFGVVQFVRQWAKIHTGRDLKSIDFLFTSGLFATEGYGQ